MEPLNVFSNVVLLEEENEQELLKVKKAIVEQYNPKGALEELLTDLLVSDMWRLKRIVRMKAGSSEAGFMPAEYGGLSESIAKYEKAVRRNMFSTTEKLEKLQQKRKRAESKNKEG